MVIYLQIVTCHDVMLEPLVVLRPFVGPLSIPINRGHLTLIVLSFVASFVLLSLFLLFLFLLVVAFILALILILNGRPIGAIKPQGGFFILCLLLLVVK